MSREKSNMSMMTPPLDQFITIIEHRSRNRLEVHIKGIFPMASYISNELAALHNYADMYSTIVYYINSPGGNVSTLIEMMNVSEKYHTVITVNCGECASAAFFLWAIGDVRVIARNSVFMAHRESYIYDGKTPQHLDYATFNNDQFKYMMSEHFSDILTEKEMEKAETTEVFISDKDMLGRGTGISWEQFITRESAIHEANSLIRIDGYLFLYDPENDTMTNVHEIKLGEPVRAVDVMYNIEFPENSIDNCDENGDNEPPQEVKET